MTNFLNVHADQFTRVFFNDCDSDENCDSNETV